MTSIKMNVLFYFKFNTLSYFVSMFWNKNIGVWSADQFSSTALVALSNCNANYFLQYSSFLVYFVHHQWVLLPQKEIFQP